MANLLGLERVLHWWRRGPDLRGVDPADMGTAFGMELSFLPAEEDLVAEDTPAQTWISLPLS